MNQQAYKVGDKVKYAGEEYKIEIVYKPGVYFIGNDTSFVDVVTDEMLKEKCDANP